MLRLTRALERKAYRRGAGSMAVLAKQVLTSIQFLEVEQDLQKHVMFQQSSGLRWAPSKILHVIYPFLIPDKQRQRKDAIFLLRIRLIREYFVNPCRQK